MSNNMNSNGSYMPVGTTLQSGKYRIESHLASGGFGNTYKAKNLFFDEIVAIKEFYMRGITHRDDETSNVCVSNSDNEPMFVEQKEKFLKEARRIYKLSKLDCKNIVDVKDFFEENGTAYYVMGYIEGQPLSKKVKETEPEHRLPQLEVYGFIMQILDALEVVHNENLFHLDLKPGNVMVDSAGKVMLIDFGASKQTNPDGGETTKTALCYTPGYAPLEQMEQEIDHLGAWTDLYSLGGTIFYLLTGKVPPKPLKLIQEGDAALKFPDDIVAGMRNLVVKLMKPNRADRFQSVNEVRQWLAKNIKKPDRLPSEVKVAADNDATQVVSREVLEKARREKAERERRERERREREEREQREREEREQREREEREQQEAREQEENAERERKNVEEQKRLQQEEREKEQRAKKEKEERERREREQRIREEKAAAARNKPAGVAGNSLKDKLLTKKAAIGGAVALVLLLGIVGMKTCNSGGQDNEMAESDKPALVEETLKSVEKMQGSNKLGEYVYTGTVDAEGLPHGQGEAVFTNSTTAKSYKGNFVHGVMEGPDAEYTFLNGDFFKGSFKDGHFEEGKLTLAETGVSYVGKFNEDGAPPTDADGNPTEGDWYDKDGNKL